jgi:hypothetical protein
MHIKMKSPASWLRRLLVCLAIPGMVGVSGMIARGEEAPAPAAAPDAKTDTKTPAKDAVPKADAKGAEPVPAAPTVPVVPPPPIPPPVPSWGEELFGIPVHGSLTSRLRIRWTDTDHDTDLYETLSLSVGDAEQQTVTGYLLARMAVDLDGKTHSKGYYVFDSIQDTYTSPFTGQLYEAYADVHRLGPVELARLGRQTLYETPVVVFLDGARVETEDLTGLKLRFGGYGGIPVHAYESSPQGDLIAGLYGQVQPWKGGRARVDWMHVDDQTFFGDLGNDLLGLSAWQELFGRVQLYGQYTRLEDRSRDVTARATWREPDWDLVVQGWFYELLQTQRDYAIEFDPFYNAALEYHPYVQARALVGKGFGDYMTVDGGAEVRRLRDQADEGDFNHNFQRFFLTPTVQGVGLKGLSVSLTGEVWKSEDEIWSWGADVTHKCSEALKASAGTYFSLYKYDYFSATERDDVRTYYLKLRYKLSKALRLDGGYEYEHSRVDTIQTVRVGVVWDF